jgi:hypothetical protein
MIRRGCRGGLLLALSIGFLLMFLPEEPRAGAFREGDKLEVPWQREPKGEYVPFVSLKIERIRIHYQQLPPSLAGGNVPYRFYAVILTLGTSPAKDKSIKQVSLLTDSLADASLVVQELKSAKPRGLWIDWHQNWGYVSAIDY